MKIVRFTKRHKFLPVVFLGLQLTLHGYAIVPQLTYRDGRVRVMKIDSDMDVYAYYQWEECWR